MPVREAGSALDKNPSAPRRVLVLMATRNGGAWVEPQLCSILNQLDVDVTLRIRDDASSDDTPKTIRRVLDGREGWSLECNAEPSGSAAANFFELITGCDTAGQDAIAFADQDDLWNADKLARAVTTLRTTGAGGYSSAVRAEWPDGRSKLLRQSPAVRSADYLFEGAGQGCTFVLAQPAFDELRQVLTMHRDRCRGLHYHDWTIYALARSLGQRWVFDARAGLVYRQHAGNDTGARSGAAGRARRLALIRSGWYARQIDTLCALLEGVHAGRIGVVGRYRELLASSATPWGRVELVGFVLLHGRRKWSDRLVLAWAAGKGLLSRT